MLFILAGVLALPACMEGKVRRTTTTVVDSGLDEVARDPDRLKRMFPVEVEDAARELARGLVDGSLDALGEQDRQAKLHEMSEQFVERVTKAAEDAGARIGPQVHDSLVRTVDDAVSAALSPEHRRDAADLGRQVATATTRSFSKQMATGIDEDLAPALRRALEEELGPGLHKMLVEEVNPALAATARDMTGAALGEVDRAIREDLRGSLQEAFFDPLRESLQKGKETAERWLVVLAGVLAVLAIVLAIVLVWFRQKWVAADATAQKRRGTIKLFAEAVAAARREGAIEHYCTHIKTLGAQPDHADAYAELQHVLSSNPRLKLPSRLTRP
jgi:hypothetical protein